MPLDHAEITICASSRFYGEVASIAGELRAAGLTVYTPRLDYNEDEDEDEDDRMTKHSLTTAFLQKVAASDSILIVNPGGYVGMSVAIEAGFAFALGKTIYALDVPSEYAVDALVDRVLSHTELIKK